ncbi:MerR family transcriptional regulator [uncultured Robinsoniella sp.]|uniref:MerR family transcriptional regulator n=1 Tax=uncultured Robinsoniella sp. TaxID=904190 RepID=UPI00374F6192
MKTVKEVSDITGVSIRTLRYYDEIGLLKPTRLTEAGYRLYDNQALEKLQQIMFFREIEVSLSDIKEIMDSPGYDKEQVLLTQKALLEKKRNSLNGLIELITDVMKGVNTMSFEAFNDKDVQQILDHMCECISPEDLEQQIKKYGSVDKMREQMRENLKDEHTMADLIKWYGSKEKAVDAALQSTGNKEDFVPQQNENEEVYRRFAIAKETKDADLEKESVAKLAEIYKGLFKLDNARSILLDLAKEYLKEDKLAEVTDAQYGEGIARYVGSAILNYYGI